MSHEEVFKPKKTWQEYWESLKETVTEPLKEDAEPTNTIDGVENADAPMFKMSRFAGVDCIEVDDDTYHKCKFGKKPYSRWSGVIEDEGLRDFVQKQYQKSSKLMVQNAKTGSITYLRR